MLSVPSLRLNQFGVNFYEALLSGADLQSLVEAKEKKRQADLPRLGGWRRQLIGALLLQILDGSVTVSVDPAKGVLRMSGDTVTTSLS